MAKDSIRNVNWFRKRYERDLGNGHSSPNSLPSCLIFRFSQDDMCLWNLTVRETIMFTGKLRLPQSLPEHEKEARVTELLSMLGIAHVANSMIGKEGRRGISGGERKRVSIGVELITSPDVLFLDEPTSGLGETGGVCRSQP